MIEPDMNIITCFTCEETLDKYWNNFSKNIFSFLGHLPTTAYLKAQHTSYEHQMKNELKLNKHYLVISKGFLVGVQIRKILFPN